MKCERTVRQTKTRISVHIRSVVRMKKLRILNYKMRPVKILIRPREGTGFAHITKTRLFKYIENFTNKKKENFQMKNSDIFFIYLLKT